MKKWIPFLLILLIASPVLATSYYMRADGTAANKAAASGPCWTVGNAMNISVHNGET